MSDFVYQGFPEKSNDALSSFETLSNTETTSCWKVAAAVLLTAGVLLACRFAHMSNVFASKSPLSSGE